MQGTFVSSSCNIKTDVIIVQNYCRKFGGEKVNCMSHKPYAKERPFFLYLRYYFFRPLSSVYNIFYRLEDGSPHCHLVTMIHLLKTFSMPKGLIQDACLFKGLIQDVLSGQQTLLIFSK